MRTLHIVSGLADSTNGIAVAAKLMAGREGASVMSCADFAGLRGVSEYDEVVVHGCWLPCYWKACWKVLRSRAAVGKPRLVRMTHANLDPVRVRFHGWKKRLVSPVERWLFSKCDRVMVTGEWEKTWCGQWGISAPFEIVDLKRFFEFPKTSHAVCANGPLRILYLGRRHPLKGTDFLERAVREINEGCGTKKVELRMVSDHAGDALERDWAWCDVLCLPTLSENFGLVVAEALARGKRVITTDGAPAWENQEGVVYLRGYRDGDDATRVKMLKEALGHVR